MDNNNDVYNYKTVSSQLKSKLNTQVMSPKSDNLQKLQNEYFLLKQSKDRSDELVCEERLKNKELLKINSMLKESLNHKMLQAGLIKLYEIYRGNFSKNTLTELEFFNFLKEDINLKEQNIDLKEQLIELKEKFSNFKEEVQMDLDHKFKMTERLNDLEKFLSLTEDNLSSLTSELEDNLKNFHLYDYWLQNKDTNIEKFLNNNNDCFQKVNSLLTKLNTLCYFTINSSSDLKKLNDNFASKVEDLCERAKNKEEYKIELENLNNQLGSLRESSLEMKKYVEQCEERIATLNHHNIHLQNFLENSETTIKYYEEQINQQKEQYNSSEFFTQKRHNTEIESLKDQIVALENYNNELRTKHENLIKSITENEISKQFQQRENDIIQETAESAIQINAKLKDKNSSLKSENKSLNLRIKELTNEIGDLKNNSNQLFALFKEFEQRDDIHLQEKDILNEYLNYLLCCNENYLNEKEKILKALSCVFGMLKSFFPLNFNFLGYYESEFSATKNLKFSDQLNSEKILLFEKTFKQKTIPIKNYKVDINDFEKKLGDAFSNINLSKYPSNEKDEINKLEKEVKKRDVTIRSLLMGEEELKLKERQLDIIFKDMERDREQLLNENLEKIETLSKLQNLCHELKLQITTLEQQNRIFEKENNYFKNQRQASCDKFAVISTSNFSLNERILIYEEMIKRRESIIECFFVYYDNIELKSIVQNLFDTEAHLYDAINLSNSTLKDDKKISQLKRDLILLEKELKISNFSNFKQEESYVFENQKTRPVIKELNKSLKEFKFEFNPPDKTFSNFSKLQTRFQSPDKSTK